MPKITLRLAIAFFTFAIGIAATALWLTRRAHKVETPARPACQWLASGDNISYNRFPNDVYFPAGVFMPDESSEKYGARDSSSLLHTMDEPSLSSLNDNNLEVYRFLWRRSFHPPVVIRLWRSGDERCMSVKQADRIMTDNEYEYSDKLTVNNTRPLTKGEWEGFIDLIEDSQFWSMAAGAAGPTADDGARWMIEGMRNQKYHVVNRHNPNDDAYRQAGIYLIRISGIKIDESRNELY